MTFKLLKALKVTEILELVVDEDALHVQPHGSTFGTEHVSGELEGHGRGDEDEGAELDLTLKRSLNSYLAPI